MKRKQRENVLINFSFQNGDAGLDLRIELSYQPDIRKSQRLSVERILSLNSIRQSLGDERRKTADLRCTESCST